MNKETAHDQGFNLDFSSSFLRRSFVGGSDGIC